MKVFLQDPLFHFILIGTALFLLFKFTDTTPVDAPETIAVDEAQIERITAAWKKQWRRLPTEDELEKLIQQHIDEEVLFREAVNLGLDKDDTIIRRRLSQKMKFLIKDIASSGEPEEQLLKNFHSENLDSYIIPARYSFSHIFFNPDLRGSRTIDDAQKILATLNTVENKHLENDTSYGDSFMLHLHYKDVAKTEIARLFGKNFARQVNDLAAGKWHGPISSGYGIHLIRIEDIISERTPDYNEVKDRVLSDYMRDFQLRANDKAIEELRSRYRIIINGQPQTGPGHAVSVSASKNGSSL